MKQYYFLKGREQQGPFTIDELQNKGLSNETLIWEEGTENWIKVKDHPELVEIFKAKNIPPPLPPDRPTIEEIKPSRKALTVFLIWASFNLFALLMSYSQIRIFNKGKPHTDKFWPFVEFVTTSKWFSENSHLVSTEYEDPVTHSKSTSVQYVDNPGGEWKENEYFNGIFTEYDWTEFAFYVGGAVVIFILVRISNKTVNA